MAADSPIPARTLQRSAAFRAAARHTLRVRVLRVGLLAGSLLAIVALTTYAVFDPFGKMPQNVSIAGAGLNGTRVTMQMPKLAGYRADGRPYNVTAESGIQDIRRPNVIELNEIEATFDTEDKTTVHLLAPAGVYDSKADFLTLQGAVRITSNTGYDIRMTNADMNLKAGTVVSKDPVSVTTSNGTIHADSLDMADNGKRIGFVGHVETVMSIRPSDPVSDAEGRR